MAVHLFVAKPVQVEAIEWTGNNIHEIRDFTNNLGHMSGDFLVIETTEGTSRASIGDWIVRGTQGEFYPVKPRVMEAKYTRSS